MIDYLPSLTEHFDKRAAVYGKDYRSCDYRFKWSFLQRQGLVLKWTRRLTDQKILDVGCGPGILTEFLASRNFLVGLDLSSKMLLLAKESLRPVQGEGDSLPFQSESFDAALAIETLQHVQKPLPFLKELSRVTRPGGSLILTALNQKSLLHRTLLRSGLLKHSHFFHPLEEVCNLLNDENLRIQEIRFLGFPFPVTWRVVRGSFAFSSLAASWAIRLEKNR